MDQNVFEKHTVPPAPKLKKYTLMYLHTFNQNTGGVFFETNTQTHTHISTHLPLRYLEPKWPPVLEKTLLGLFWPQNRRLGGGFKQFLMFTPKIGEDSHPFWLGHIFPMGWFNSTTKPEDDSQESRSGSTIRTLLHGKINPKDWKVLFLGDVGFTTLFLRVVSGDYGIRYITIWKSPGLCLGGKTFQRSQSWKVPMHNKRVWRPFRGSKRCLEWWRGWLEVWHTPPKTNMEPENDGF